jgi:hypothetical protein
LVLTELIHRGDYDTPLFCLAVGQDKKRWDNWLKIEGLTWKVWANHHLQRLQLKQANDPSQYTLSMRLFELKVQEIFLQQVSGESSIAAL